MKHFKKTIVMLCLPFREQLLVSSRGHIWTKSYLSEKLFRVCVCETHRLSRATLVCVHKDSRASGTCFSVS